MADVIDDVLVILRECQLDDPAVRDFFDVVIDAYRRAEDDDGPPLDTFLRLLRFSDDTDTFRSAIEPFLEYIEYSGIEPLRLLETTGVDTLVRWYGDVPDDVAPGEEPAEAVTEDEVDEEPYDEQAWFAFLARYGPEWSGENETWQAFRDYFLYYADEEGLTTPATAFVEYADGESDRVAFFAQYGIEVGAVEDDTDLDAWYAFLADSGVEWDGQDGTWPRFRRAFLEAAASHGLTSSASGFLDYAEGEPDRLAFLTQYGMVAEPEPDEVDPDAWAAFLEAFGPAWNGDEANWEAFRAYFLHHAAEWDVESTAIGFVDYAEGEPDKIAFFAQYGVDVAAPEAEAGAPPEAEGDVWSEFLAAFGPAWNGDEANWEAFRAYFLHHAAEWDVEQTAVGFVDYAEGEPDKIAFFAQYGIDVTAPETEAVEAADDEVVEAARQRAQEVATTSPLVPAEQVTLVSDAFAELVGQVPEAAGLSAAQVRQLIEEVAAEHL